jgi:hypothetical protein
MHERAETALEDPQAKLERAFIEEFLEARGFSLASISLQSPGERRALLLGAARYADIRLAEIDARASYIHQIHGGASRQ